MGIPPSWSDLRLVTEEEVEEIEEMEVLSLDILVFRLLYVCALI